jgi:Rad3-related DNA helicase
MSLSDYNISGIDSLRNLVVDISKQYHHTLKHMPNNEHDIITKYKIRKQKYALLLYELINHPYNIIYQIYTGITNNNKHGTTMISTQPIKISRFAHKFFDAPHQLFQSSTIHKEMFCKTMGFDPHDCKFIQITKSPIPLQNRQIKFLNTCSLNMHSNAFDYQKIYHDINNILSTYKTKKGIILVTSKKQCISISHNLKNNRIIILYNNDNHNDTTSIIKRYKKIKTPQVLLSPSLWCNIDLKGSQSRFQIIVKTPYPSMADPRTKIKAKKDPTWYKYTTLVRFLQGCDRSIRDDNDFAITFVLDSSATKLIRDMSQYIPLSYLDSLNEVLEL